MAGMRLDGDGAEAAGLVVLEGLDELGAGVHHEGPVGSYRLADGLAAQQQYVQLGAAALLGGVCGHRDHVTGAVRSRSRRARQRA